MIGASGTRSPILPNGSTGNDEMPLHNELDRCGQWRWEQD